MAGFKTTTTGGLDTPLTIGLETVISSFLVQPQTHTIVKKSRLYKSVFQFILVKKIRLAIIQQIVGFLFFINNLKRCFAKRMAFIDLPHLN